MLRPGRGTRIGALLALAAVLVSCGGSSTQPSERARPGNSGGTAQPQDGGGYVEHADPGFGHVHGIGLNPGDGHVYAATHYGVFRIEEGKPPVRTAGGSQDTMGFVVAGADRFLGSGHPAPGSDGPPHLGLIVSTDRAQTWQEVSLRGEADFHALAVAGSTIYGWDSTSSRVLRSDDDGGTWARGAVLPVADLAVDPRRPDEVLATTPSGLQRSVDGGATFTLAKDAPEDVLMYVEAVPRVVGGLAGLSPNGRLWLRTGTSWRAAAQLPGPPRAFAVPASDHFLAATDDGVYASTDGGKSWRQIAQAGHG